MLSPVLRQKSRHVRLASVASLASACVGISSLCYHHEEDENSTQEDTTTHHRRSQSLMASLEHFHHHQQQQSMMMMTMKTDCSAAVASVTPSSPQGWFGSSVREEQLHHLPTPIPARRRSSKERLLEDTRTNTFRIDSKYEVDWKQPPVGEGAFGTVYKGVDRSTGDTVAIKKIPKDVMEYPGIEEDLEREMDALLLIRDLGGHKNVCELRENYETDQDYLIVFDYIEGIELFDHLYKMGTLTEKEAARNILELVDALKFLHSNGIVHSDLKCENIMMVNTTLDCDPLIRVVDFGNAHILGDANEDDRRRKLTSRSPSYCPPEALKQVQEESDDDDHMAHIDPSFDQWSLGVVLYIMLVGVHPFDINADSSIEEIEQRVLGGLKPPLGRNNPYTNHLSHEAVDLIEGLLEWDPTKRLTADEVMEHPWIKKMTR